MMRGERQRVGDGTSGMGTFAIYILRLQRYWQLFLPPIKNAVMIKIHFFILHISQISLLPDLEKKVNAQSPPPGMMLMPTCTSLSDKMKDEAVCVFFR